MAVVMVRYKVKAGRSAENERYINDVFELLKREAPAGVHYASFKQADGVSFVHIASTVTTEGVNPLTSLSAFKTFASQIKDRCEEGPLAVDLVEVGSYRFFAD